MLCCQHSLWLTSQPMLFFFNRDACQLTLMVLNESVQVGWDGLYCEGQSILRVHNVYSTMFWHGPDLSFHQAFDSFNSAVLYIIHVN